MRRYLIYLACVLISLGGCGYTSRSLIADKYKTIAIPPFTSSIDITSEQQASRGYVTYRPALERDVTKRAIDRFMLDGNLRIVKSEEADLVLIGELKEFVRDAVRYDDDDNVEEYRITITVGVILKDRRENKTVWDDSTVAGDTTYFLTGPNAKSEEAAVNDALDDLARRIVERTVEYW